MAELLGIHVQTLRLRKREWGIPEVKIGRKMLRYQVGAVFTSLAKRFTTTGSDGKL
jgi:hypothetical protein